MLDMRATINTKKGKVEYHEWVSKDVDHTQITDLTITRKDGVKFYIQLFWSVIVLKEPHGEVEYKLNPRVDNTKEFINKWCNKHALPAYTYVLDSVKELKQLMHIDPSEMFNE